MQVVPRPHKRQQNTMVQNPINIIWIRRKYHDTFVQIANIVVDKLGGL